MAKESSKMLALGTQAPSFTLLDVAKNKLVSLSELKSDTATVVMFICNHCPYVKHIKNKLIDVANHYLKKNIKFIAISSNDIETYPADSPEQMRQEVETYHFPFPYLYDETQDVAKAYQAACTPDLYVFDAKMECVYRGRFDDSTPGNDKPVTGDDLSQALDAILSGNTVESDQKPSVGCGIKWK